MKKSSLKILFIVFSASVLLAQNVKDIKIGIVYSAATKQLLHQNDNNFSPIQDWELFFLNRKIHYTVYDDDQLDDNDFAGEDVLILPSVEVLSENARANLVEFKKSGKGILIFGEIGTYDTDGRKNRSDFMQDLANFNVAKLQTDSKIAEGYSLKTNYFLSTGIPGNFKLTILNRYQPNFAIRTNNVMKLGNYIFVDDDNDSKSGIVASANGMGRLVWFGFQLSQISVDRSQKQFLSRIIFNSLEWLSGKPLLSVSQWQSGVLFPIIIESIISDPNKLRVESLNDLYNLNVKNNYFINADKLADANYNLTKLAASGEINLNFDLSDSHKNDKEIDKLFQKSYKILLTNSRQNLFGLRFENPYAEIDSISIAPFDFIRVNDGKIYLHSLNKNRELITIKNAANLSDISPENILNELKSKIKNSENTGDALFIKIVDQAGSPLTKEYFSKIEQAISFMKENHEKFLSYSELIDWLQKRDNIFISTNKVGEHKFKITVENHNQKSVENLPINLDVVSKGQTPYITEQNFKIELSTNSKKYVITIPYLGASMKTSFTLNF